jgi:hypothetical protein
MHKTQRLSKSHLEPFHIGTAFSRLGVIEGSELSVESGGVNESEAATSGGAASEPPPKSTGGKGSKYKCAPIGSYESNPLCF